MRSSITSIGLVGLVIICILLGYEYFSFNHASNDPVQTDPPQSDLAPHILNEVKRVEEELFDSVLKSLVETIKHPAPVLNGGHNDEISKLLDSKFETFQQGMQKSIGEMSKLKFTSQNTDSPKYEYPPSIEKIYTSVNDDKPWKNISLPDRVGEYGKDKCKRKEKIYFLKTSKTGSTTMANILMRFGFSRPGTNFLMGESSNAGMFFLNGYMPYNENLCYLGKDIANRPRFDLSYVHMR